MSTEVNLKFTEYSIAKTKKALYDSFGALIPVKPVRFIGSNILGKIIELEVIENVPNPSGYKIGEIIESCERDLVPVDKIMQSKQSIHLLILNTYKWID